MPTKVPKVVVFALALLASVQTFGQTHDRFQLEILPIEIVWDTSDAAVCSDPQLEDCADTLKHPPMSALPNAMNLVRSAMDLLGVFPHEYDLVLTEHEPEHLTCRQPNALVYGINCTHETLGAFDTYERIQDMMIEFGHSRYYPSHQGSALLGVLLLPEGFVWGRTLYGVNSWWSWNGWDPEDLHWTTTSCAIWSAPWLSTIAHEIGHCFGLWHADDPANDWNYDGLDNSVDLMGGSHLMTFNLRPSNQARVRHHFRKLTQTETEELWRRPSKPVPGRVAID